MGEELVKDIYHISEKCGCSKVAVVTNHLKIMGDLYKDDNSGKKHEGFVTLTNAKMWRLEDICNCKDPECKCNEANFCELEWIHVNVYKIVAFSLVK